MINFEFALADFPDRFRLLLLKLRMDLKDFHVAVN